MSVGTNELPLASTFADNDSLIVDSVTDDDTVRLTGAMLKAYIRQGGGRRYGYRVKIDTADPDARVEYIYDAVGMTPASMGSSSFSYGDWGNIWFVAENHPAMIKADGTLDYKLAPNNYGLKSDGITASDVSNTSYNGNAMSGIPTVWYKRWTENGYRYFVCCETQYDETYHADVHIKQDGTVRDFKYMAMFEAALVSNKLRSLLLTNNTPANMLTHDQFLTYAQANGPEWILCEWGAYELVVDLLTLMSKSTNGQAKFGRGRTTKSDGSTAGSAIGDALKPGANSFSTRGQFFGYPSSNIYGVKVFHIENFWGNLWKHAMGAIQSGGYLYTKMNSFEGEYNLAASGYKRTAIPICSSSDGNITTTWAGREGVVPRAIDGTTYNSGFLNGHTTYECDHFWMDTTQTTVCLLSGDCDLGVGAGPRCRSFLNPASWSGWHGGAFLSLK